ncbi:hypothetical protein Agub_g4495, partial [Astrephomene gubernaculifera]
APAPVLRVGVADVVMARGRPGAGRGLVALADVAPGEVLLSVPLSRVFSSQPNSELHWSADMALRLLRARHRAQTEAAARAATATAGEGEVSLSAARDVHAVDEDMEGEEGEGLEEDEEEQVDWGPWIRMLPSAVRTPLEYDDAEVRQLGCPYVIEEVRAMQQCMRDCYEVVRQEVESLGCGWKDFLWAVQVRIRAAEGRMMRLMMG